MTSPNLRRVLLAGAFAVGISLLALLAGLLANEILHLFAQEVAQNIAHTSSSTACK